MLPNLDFIKTLVNGLYCKIKDLATTFEEKINSVDGKIHTPDYNAAEGENGFIKNKPTLIGWHGTWDGDEIFNYKGNIADGGFSHAEGLYTKATGAYSHAEGRETEASNWTSHAEGYYSVAGGYASHAEGSRTVTSGKYSHAEGLGTNAHGTGQHVEGEYNIIDKRIDDADHGKYLHIAGNGTDNSNRSNAYTLDWDGNAWFAGSVEGTALILTSPGGKRFRITVDDDGTLQSAEVAAV